MTGQIPGPAACVQPEIPLCRPQAGPRRRQPRRIPVPAPPEPVESGCRLRRQALVITAQEGLQLALMRPVILAIGLPDQRLRCPLRTHEGILTADKVEVAGP